MRAVGRAAELKRPLPVDVVDRKGPIGKAVRSKVLVQPPPPLPQPTATSRLLPGRQQQGAESLQQQVTAPLQQAAPSPPPPLAPASDPTMRTHPQGSVQGASPVPQPQQWPLRHATGNM